MGFNSQGKFTTFPNVFLTVNADALDLRPVSPLGVVAILGQGAGLLPPGVATSLPLGTGSPERFISPSELLTSVNFGVKPFAQLGRGVGEVLVVPVNKSTQSTFAINATGPVLLATLKSKGYGLKFNSILVKIEATQISIKLVLASGNTVLEVFPYAGATAIADLCAAINERSGLASAVFTAQGTPIVADFTAMTGGTEPAAVNSDWSEAIHALDGRRVNAIHVASASTTIWAMLADYAIQKRCRGFVGGALQNWNGLSNRQTAAAALKAAAATLNAPRMMHAGLGGDGQPGYISAARYAALAAALDPSEPMTFKHLDFASLEARLDIDSEVGNVDGLLISGVAVPVPDPDSPNTFLLSRGLSTWTGDDNLYRREHSVLAAVDAVTDQLESGCRQFLGSEATPATAQRAIALVDQILFEATKQSARIRIISYRRESISAQVFQTTMTISAKFTPIPPLNFIPIGIGLENADFIVTFDVPLTA